MTKKISYPGTDHKFQVTSTQQDFQLTEDSFEITIKDQYGRVRWKLAKDDCFWDSDGNYYFVLENVRQGVYFAYFTGSYEDDDYDKQQRVFTDVQHLLDVGYRRGCGCREHDSDSSDSCPCKCGRHAVNYTEVFTVSIDGDDYLCGSDGKYILTSDGKRIAFKNPKRKQIEDMGKVILDTMTGEEFKTFVEGRKKDGTINTLPEMLDAAHGISDDETIQDDVKEQIDEGLQQNMGTHADIDEIFNS